MRGIVGIVAIALIALAAAPARADYADDAALGLSIAKGGFDRFRRGIALGPEVGGVAGIDVDGNGAHGFSVGLGLYTFDVPVFDLQRLVADAIRQRVKARLAEILATGGVPPADLGQLAREVAADVQAELLGGGVRRRALERPQWKVLLEYLRLSGANGLRAGLSRGVRHASVGLGIGGLRAGGETQLIVGAEVSLHLTPIGRARTPVFDLFVRGDLPLAGPDGSLVVLAGGRLLVDLL